LYVRKAGGRSDDPLPAFVIISGEAAALTRGFFVLKKLRQRRHLFLAYNGKVTERTTRRM